jgi:ADP-heptose:LPS heptosyltransferase
MMQNSYLPSVVIAPFANERVREWPARMYSELIDIIVRLEGYRVTIVGTRGQRVRANAIVRGLSSEQVANTCGSLAWSDLLALIDSSAYVVANNSGIAHLAASRGVWTLCIFAASHAMSEWMPRGPRVVTISRSLSCSPCSIGADLCPNDLACMSGLEADEIFWRFQRIREESRPTWS